MWTDTWRVVLPAPPPAVRGTYLLALTGCHTGVSGCSRAVIPVCISHGRITGEPGAVDDGGPDASSFGRQPAWRKYHSCRHASFGGGLGAQYESSTHHPDPRRLPADLAARVP